MICIGKLDSDQTSFVKKMTDNTRRKSKVENKTLENNFYKVLAIIETNLYSSPAPTLHQTPPFSNDVLTKVVSSDYYNTLEEIFTFREEKGQKQEQEELKPQIHPYSNQIRTDFCKL